ncbi:MAG: GNAT family N-acetyltransferase [Chloroflexi bacterium]|nr:GNAT family N-acetyltransferase [Chloroflexota bacterium]
MINIWQGKLVKLRAVEPDDWRQFFAWDQDTDYGRYTWHIDFPPSKEGSQKWMADLAIAAVKNDEYRWVIENLDGQFVGTINTHTCDSRAGAFQYGIAIGREHRRKGYATETIQLVVAYFFREKRYQKVNAHIYSFNEESVILHRRLGFQEEGRLRRMGYTDGAYFDHILMGMTREEFGEFATNLR